MIERTLSKLYTQLKNDNLTEEIRSNSDGELVFIIGSQRTGYTWIGFEVDATDDEDAESRVSSRSQQLSLTQTGLTDDLDSADTSRFRVIRLDPNRTETVGLSQETLQYERQEQFIGCQYMICDVAIPTPTHQSGVEPTLTQLIEVFNSGAMSRDVLTGNVRGNRSLISIFRQYVAPDIDIPNLDTQ